MDKAVCITSTCVNYNIDFDFPHADASYCFGCDTEMSVTHSPECASLIRCLECGAYYERSHFDTCLSDRAQQSLLPPHVE